MGFKKPSNSGGWQECMRKFVELTQGVTIDKDTWFKVWLVLLADEWFRELVRTTACTALKRCHLSRELVLDIERELDCALATSLMHNADLNLFKCENLTGPVFLRWMRSLARNVCFYGIRKWYPEHRRLIAEARKHGALARPATEDNRERLDREIDTKMAAKKLAEPFRSVILLRLEEFTIDEIATKFGWSYWKAHRVVKKGEALLKRPLRDYGPSTDGPNGAN